MGDFIAAVVSYPTAVYTTMLGVVLVYWLLAIIGIVDFDSSGVDLDLEAHAEGSVTDVGVLAGYVVAMGLNGVPFSIVVSLLVLLLRRRHGRRLLLVSRRLRRGERAGREKQDQN